MMSKVENIECMTHKTGKFVFSCAFDEQTIMNQLIRATILYQSVVDLPVLPSVAAKLREELIRSSIFGTAAIEGNSLSEEEVGEVLKSNKAEGLKEKAEIEIDNIKNAYELLSDYETKSTFYMVDEELIKTIHEILTYKLDYYHNSPGMYRNEIVKVGDKNHGGIYTPPKTLDDIKLLMSTFIEWINNESMMSIDPFIRGALAHYYLARIHPFQDGNGRTARFLEALILNRANIKYIPVMMSNYYHRRIDKYFIAFSESQKRDKYDITPFIDFFFNGVIESLNKIKAQVIYSIRVLSLKDFYLFEKEKKSITKRQYDLLMILIETLSSFTLNSLFIDPIFKVLYESVSISTARRDLNKLTKNQYILFDKTSGKYSLNFTYLG